MIFDEIPFELKEYIFTYVTPNEWINTAKVSREWMDLTLRSIKKVESHHVLILDHLAEYINQQSDTIYTWVSLLTLMPKLKHLECCENTEAFWTEISPICDHLKILDCKPQKVESFDWNKLDISFKNLVELRWDGWNAIAAFPVRILELAPKLKKITLKRLKINAEWKHKIPKSVKHILLKDVQWLDEQQCSMKNLCEDTSALETFSACCKYSNAVSHIFDAPRLKKLELRHPKASDTLQNALRRCPNLETVCIARDEILVTDSWRKCVPASVKSFEAWEMSIADNVRRDFSFNWLFQNYDALQSLKVACLDWTGFDPQKFQSPKNLKKLHLDNDRPPRASEPIDPFSTICNRMIRGSYLVDVEICEITIDESWRQILSATVKRLKMCSFMLSDEAKEVFSPQFICENPSNLEFLSLNDSAEDLPAMDLNAFSGMNKLQELHLNDIRLSGACLQSILTHCSALTNLFIQEFIPGALADIPPNLVLPSLRILDVEEPVDQPSLLLQHFPKMRKVYITFIPTKECWLEVMHCLRGVEAAEIHVMIPSFDLLWSLIECIDDTELKYFYLSVKYGGSGEFFFYLKNSLLDACSYLHRLSSALRNLWTKNYLTSPLLRDRMSNIPSSRDELLYRYHDIQALENDSFTIYFGLFDDGSDDDENDE